MAAETNETKNRRCQVLDTAGANIDPRNVKGTSDGGTTFHHLKTNGDGELAINLETADIEIGAVELKDSATDTRANIKAANTARTTGTIVVATQAVDAAGAVLKTSTIETNSGTIAGDTTSLDGKVTACNTGAVVVSSGTITETNSAMISAFTEAIEGRISLCDTDAVTISTALPAGASKVGDTGLIGNSAANGSGTDYHITADSDGFLHTQAFRLSGGDSARMLVDTDRHGQVDVLTLPNVAQATAANLNMTEASASGIKTDTATIAGDTTSLDGKVTACNTGAIAGTVTANAGTNLNTSTLATESGGNLATIAGDTTSLDGKVTACNTGAVVVSSGAITETNSGGIKTAVQLIDDAISTHDSAATAKGAQLNAVYDSTKPTAVADGDAVRVLADSYGRLLAGVEPEKFQATITSADATAATSVKAKTAAKKIHILSLIISIDTAMSVQLQDDAGTPAVLMEQIYLAANGGCVVNFPPESPLIVATNQDLDVITSAAGNISVTVTGYLAA